MKFKRIGDDEVIIQFKAVLRAILDYLQHGEYQRAINYIESILKDN
jgi:hypothetical protein